MRKHLVALMLMVFAILPAPAIAQDKVMQHQNGSLAIHRGFVDTGSTVGKGLNLSAKELETVINGGTVYRDCRYIPLRWTGLLTIQMKEVCHRQIVREGSEIKVLRQNHTAITGVETLFPLSTIATLILLCVVMFLLKKQPREIIINDRSFDTGFIFTISVISIIIIVILTVFFIPSALFWTSVASCITLAVALVMYSDMAHADNDDAERIFWVTAGLAALVCIEIVCAYNLW